MMRRPRSNKASRSIPEHVKRAVRARDGSRCRNCKVETEFLHFDHIFPYDLGGPTTVENMQLLCPTCNTSKGNRITCRSCGHWMSPDNATCEQCAARLTYTKHSDTLTGKLENFFHKVGRAVVIGGVALGLILLLISGLYIASYFRNSDNSAAANDARNVILVVNASFNSTFAQAAAFPMAVPAGATNARVTGGYRVTSGPGVNFLILDQAQYQLWEQGNRTPSAVMQRMRSANQRVRQALSPGNYYMVFASTAEGNQSIVAAEFYLKYD